MVVSEFSPEEQALDVPPFFQHALLSPSHPLLSVHHCQKEVKKKFPKDSKVNLKAEIDETYLECHELQVTNEMLQEKLQKAEAESSEYFRTINEDKERFTGKNRVSCNICKKVNRRETEYGEKAN